MASTGGNDREEQLSREVLRHLLGVVHAMKTHVTALAATFDLTPSQLAALSHLDEPRSQRELAECLHFDASNVTDIVDRLEERGLVVRTVDPPRPPGPPHRASPPRARSCAGKLFERGAGDRADALVAHRRRAADAAASCSAKIAEPVELPF